jgi:hypothetical protein
MGVVDWRAWVAQNGGQMPTAPNPPGTPYLTDQLFPGVGPIPDLINGPTSIPPYPNTPTTVNALDPFYVPSISAYPNGGGWVAKMGDYWYTWAGATESWPAGSPGSAVPAGPIMRPAIPGLTSP